MSYNPYFSLTTGLAKSLIIPKGRIQFMRDLIDNTENTLNIKREKYLDNPEYWAHNVYKDIDDDELCKTAENHNHEVQLFYDLLSACSIEPAVDGEELTPEIFAELLPGLRFIEVPSERWNGEYYTQRMKTIYDVMRGRTSEVITFNAQKLTTKQAAQVIILFSEFLDHDDRRLDVPKGHDYLASSYDGGYEWCEKCGAITWDDAMICNRKKCPIQAEEKENNPED